MKKALLVTVFVTFLPFTLSSAEPSAFGAGDLTNPNPYGLTSTEETLLQNKKNLRKVFVKTNNQANEVDSIRERIDGLQTIIESLSRKAQSNKLNLKKLVLKNEEGLKNRDEYEKRLSTFTQLNNDNITINKNEIEKFKLIVSELSSLIDSINANYITKREFDSLVNDVNRFKDLVAKELKSGSKKSKLDGMKNSDIAKKAEDFFKKKYYTNAIKYYNYLIAKNYKPAKAHYMIGEMNFRRRNYANAISYFKKSASLYSKASYMPSLMLNTAISMEKTGDHKKAKVFFKAVIKKYPETKYAIKAEEYLNL